MVSSVSFGTVAPAEASPAGGRSTTLGLGRRAARPSTARTIPAATKVVAAKQQQPEQKGLFEAIFGALYKEEQLLETDPVLNKVGAPASKITAGKKAATAAPAEQSGGFGGLFTSFKKG